MNEYNIFKDSSVLKDRFKADLQAIVGDVSDSTIEELLQRKISAEDIPGYNKISEDEFNQKVIKNIVLKYQSINDGKIINHTDFKLSQLDLEMIRNVPQGGSWKDIPMETAQKSKRLLRITKTGGRTTLYGRIDYQKPSYTITTYFNRPGNGTYVHPIHQRVISVREAARFQCFPDEYYFFGSKSDKLKQVGNAVPTLLAYNIGKALVEKIGVSTSVDLFSGAGGMTYGFKRAGIKAAIASDIIENACITLKTNNPEINVLCGDITKSEVKEKIIKFGIDANADIICGGPPCQGFSLAGFRNENDPRNLLFKPFVEIVSKVNPKVVVFENVEGIMSYQGGKTYQEVLSLFSELGYIAEGRKLLASQYGAPQRRKRVIILCIRKDLKINPSTIFPKFITPNIDKQATAYQTIYDLENVPCDENAQYTSEYTSPILKMLKGEISIDDYLTEMYDDGGVLDKEEDNESPEQLSLFDETEI